MSTRIIPSPALAAALADYGRASCAAAHFADPRWGAALDAAEQALLATIEADAERALREGIEAGERERAAAAEADDGPRLHIPADLITNGPRVRLP